MQMIIMVILPSIIIANSATIKKISWSFWFHSIVVRVGLGVVLLASSAIQNDSSQSKPAWSSDFVKKVLSVWLLLVHYRHLEAHFRHSLFAVYGHVCTGSSSWRWEIRIRCRGRWYTTTRRKWRSFWWHQWVVCCIYIGAWCIVFIGKLWLYTDSVPLGSEATWEHTGLFEGDIYFPEQANKRNGQREMQRRWPGGIVPYTIDQTYSE